MGPEGDELSLGYTIYMRVISYACLPTSGTLGYLCTSVVYATIIKSLKFYLITKETENRVGKSKIKGEKNKEMPYRMVKKASNWN